MKLSSDFKSCSDAKDGPLKPGNVGVVVEDDGSAKPFKVLFNNVHWWYDVGAVELAAEVRC